MYPDGKENLIMAARLNIMQQIRVSYLDMKSSVENDKDFNAAKGGEMRKLYHKLGEQANKSICPFLHAVPCD